MTSLALPFPRRNRSLIVFERNAMVHRRAWLILVSGFFEPLFYLVFFVYPLGDLIGEIVLDEGTLEYAAFVAPALLAASAMNGAYYEAKNVFWNLRDAKVYDAMLSTPVGPRDVALGETMYAVARAVLYAAAFLNIMLVLGLVESWWAVLVLPACVVIGFGFAGAGIAAMTWMRSWQDFDLLQLVMLPMFLFATTFFPLEVYPEAIEWLVKLLPLYHGIELVRALSSGAVSAFQLVNVAYLAAMGLAGMLIASRRIDRVLLK